MGLVSVEPRGAMTADLLVLLLAAQGSGGSEGETIEYEPSRFEIRSYGLRASLNSEIADIVVGFDRHRISGEEAREVCLGIRKRESLDEGGMTYFELLLRRGYDFEEPSGTTDYDGIELGGGALFEINEHLFLDIGLSLEVTLDRLKL